MNFCAHILCIMSSVWSIKRPAIFILLSFSSVTTLALPVAVNAQLGASKQEITVSGPASRDIPSLAGSDLSWSLGVEIGIYKSIALGLSYIDYGEAKDSYIDQFNDVIEDRFDVTAIRLYAEWAPQVSNSLNFVIATGIESWNMEINETDSSMPGQTASVSDKGTDPFLQTGFRYRFQDNLTIGFLAAVVKLDAEAASGISLDNKISSLRLELAQKF